MLPAWLYWSSAACLQQEASAGIASAVCTLMEVGQAACHGQPQQDLPLQLPGPPRYQHREALGCWGQESKMPSRRLLPQPARPMQPPWTTPSFPVKGISRGGGLVNGLAAFNKFIGSPCQWGCA